MGRKKRNQRFAFNYNDKSKPTVFIEATSRGKAWRKFRRQHEPDARKKDFTIL